MPALADRGDFNPFAGRVRAPNVGTEGEHGELRVAMREQPAFQSGVDDFQTGATAEFLPVDGEAAFKQRGIRVGRPAGIGAQCLCRAAEGFDVLNDVGGEFVPFCIKQGTHEKTRPRAGWRNFQRCEVVGSFHYAGKIGAHGGDAVGQGIERCELFAPLRQYPVGAGGGRQRQTQIRRLAPLLA